jgi:glycosyltransferase involved in cell wall biosynthesis
MRILVNLLAGNSGGQVTRAVEFFERINSFLPNATFIVIKETNSLAELKVSKNILVKNIRLGGSITGVIRRLWWENIFLKRVLAQNQANVYLTFSHYLPAIRLPLPTVVGVSNLAPFSKEAFMSEGILVRLKLLILRLTILSSVNRATRVLALSKTCKSILVECGTSADKISVASNGVDKFWEEPALQLPTSLGDYCNEPYFLYVSHFHRYKNHIRLVKAFFHLPNHLKSSYRLVLIGQPANLRYYKEVLSLIDFLDLRDRVVVVPGATKSILRSAYQGCSLFLFPSLIENSPNILLEAMRSGAPVLSSDFLPMPEFCGSSVIYFDALDELSMSAAIECALGSKISLEDLVVKSKGRSVKYTWDIFCQRVASQIEHAHLEFKKNTL